MRLTIEGSELAQAIRNGVQYPFPPTAKVTIIAGRGANEDRAEIEWDEFIETSEDVDAIQLQLDVGEKSGPAPVAEDPAPEKVTEETAAVPEKKKPAKKKRAPLKAQPDPEPATVGKTHSPEVTDNEEDDDPFA